MKEQQTHTLSLFRKTKHRRRAHLASHSVILGVRRKRHLHPIHFIVHDLYTMPCEFFLYICAYNLAEGRANFPFFKMITGEANGEVVCLVMEISHLEILLSFEANIYVTISPGDRMKTEQYMTSKTHCLAEREAFRRLAKLPLAFVLHVAVMVISATRGQSRLNHSQP